MEEIKIYTDGGCSGNPGPGGWAYIILNGTAEDFASGGERDTTNNRMELMAVISALEKIVQMGVPADRGIRLYTDSQYVRNGISQWIKNWVRNGWKTASGQPVKNRDLWEALLELEKRLSVDWNWVKGHSGDLHNEFCDDLVQKEIALLK